MNWAQNVWYGKTIHVYLTEHFAFKIEQERILADYEALETWNIRYGTVLCRRGPDRATIIYNVSKSSIVEFM